MSVYDLPHITVEEMLSGRYYRVRTDAGWYMTCPDYDGGFYKTVGTFPATYDFSTVQIVAEADLPEGAEICGDVNNPDHEIM